MGLAIVLSAALIACLSLALVGRMNGVFADAPTQRIPNESMSPLDEAERIVAYRYAKGEISPDEYVRMLAILRR